METKTFIFHFVFFDSRLRMVQLIQTKLFYHLITVNLYHNENNEI
jgi:hypothetical protein